MLQTPGLSKVPMAFEVRPVNEDILEDYSNFCSYFMGFLCALGQIFSLR